MYVILTVKLSVTLLTMFDINLTGLNLPKMKCCMLHFTNTGFLGECGDSEVCIYTLIPSRFKIRS